MDIVAQIEECIPVLGKLVRRRAVALESECTRIGISPSSAQLAVMYGGGKDSTLALILSSAISEVTGCSVRAITMIHPGLSQGTHSNIQSIIRTLAVPHEWRQFLSVYPDAEEANDEWIWLYKGLAQATRVHPRFMCVGCNLGSIVVEYKSLIDNTTHFRVTGNPPAELAEFDRWASTLKGKFSKQIDFPSTLGQPSLDYYRLWWAIYQQLFVEMNIVDHNDGPFSREDLEPERYLYDLPSEESGVGNVQIFSVLEDENTAYSPVECKRLLSAFGWRLPDDIQGGTESDCMMPAAIAALDIHQQGLEKYFDHLHSAAESLNPLPEMYERALSWAKSGRSSIEGIKLLQRIRMPNVLDFGVSAGTPVARALVEQLLPVR
jgi:hypothetical protein